MSNHNDKWRWLIGILLVVLLLGACGGEQSDPSDSDEQLPALEPSNSDGGAPGISNPSYPPPPTRAAGYPELPPPIPTLDPYPGGVAIIVHPKGEQCAEDLIFEDVDEAVSDLEAEGVQILDVEEIDLIVCQACGCPTSAHFRIQISPDDLAKAESLGWRRE